MQEEYFITWVYCFVDDFLSSSLRKRIRARGKMPTLTDAEVITMEIVGEFLGLDENKSLWQYFRTHWLNLFPTISSRSQFAKQMNNLCLLKQHILTHFFGRHNHEDVHIVDGFPLPVTHFKRAKGSQNFKGEASYGYCASKAQVYYGFKGHLLVTLNGEIAGFCLTAANESERKIAEQLSERKFGILLGDKGYLSKKSQEELSERGIELITPVRKRMQDPFPKQHRKVLNKLRRRVETSIGQLAERFNMEVTKARTLFTLTNRLTRKLLSHCLCGLFNKENGKPPLQFAHILN